MKNVIEKIFNLWKIWTDFRQENNHKDYNWSETYITWIIDELNETLEEIKSKRVIYTEDELGDIFWDYCCLLHCLEKEWKINSAEKIFERSFNKISRRVNWCISWENWEDIKKNQKIELENEQKLFDNK